ncbi:sensor histidine kinase [Streptomyces sp. NPDC001851]|uniref:sensor histidine kinase n=1 Tax=Streptomyces sp. NPDC001851 TaxID=3154529 RepID=UPI003325193A
MTTRPDRARHDLSAALRPLGQGVFGLSARRPMPHLSRFRNPLLRRLPLIGALLLAAYVAGTGAWLLTDRLRLPLSVCAALALAQALPVPLALVRPVAAWWLSLLSALPYALLTGVGSVTLQPGTPWPWTEPGMLAHLTVTLLVAGWAEPVVYTSQWLITLLTGSLLTAWLQPPLTDTTFPAVAALSAVGLALLAAVRGRREAQRKLRRQENLTEIERSRRTLLEERTRIARELHDVVAHHMSLVAVQAEAAPYRVADPPHELTDSFARIRENAVAALTELRHILGMLRSVDQNGDGRYTPQPTLENLDELVANVRAAGLRVETDVSGTPRPLPQRVELSAFRIVQEALSNAVRHAPGSQVRVELSYGRAEVGVVVANSPVAGAVKPQDGTGHGLVGMRERAAILGGTLRAGPGPGGWYEVTASLPIDEDGGETT